MLKFSVKTNVKISLACIFLWLQLLSKSLDHVKDESWFAECGDAFVKHIPLFANIPDDKVSVYFRKIVW